MGKHGRQKEPTPSRVAEAGSDRRSGVVPTGISHDQIAELAYRIWESQGRPEGTDIDDWLQAERHLQKHA